MASSVPTRRVETPAAFTLVELLVASTIALVVMGSLATLLGLFSRTASTAQALVDLGSRMRSTSSRLRQDLAGVTAPLTPPVRPESDAGYFELIEGPLGDSNDALRKTLPATEIGGDTDDVLLFTTRSGGAPFIGRFESNTIQAPTAEVAWFCRAMTNQPVAGLTLYNLHRRQFLVSAYPGNGQFMSNNSNSIVANGSGAFPVLGLVDACRFYDVSLRREGGLLVPNTLGDLTRRENRFRHQSAFPHEFLFIGKPSPEDLPVSTFNELKPLSGTVSERDGEDVILENVLSFDVRVFDENAAIKTLSSTPSPLDPDDPGYNDPAATLSSGSGAYVNLGWSGNKPSAMLALFPPSSQTAFQSGGLECSNSVTNAATFSAPTYDTWSTHYESNGLNENNALIDEGTNGTDDNGNGLVDDSGERETSPPYPVTLRGLEVRIRCYEPTSRQIRQVTIRHSFER